MEILILAVFLAAIGGIAMVVSGLEAWNNAALFRETPAKSVAETAGDGLVRIRGTVRPGEQGLLRVPLLNHQVVWYSLEVFEPQAGVSSRSARRILSMSDGLAFLVDDGSGQCALVRPEGAKALVDHQEVEFDGSADDISPDMVALLADRGFSPASLVSGTTYRCEVKMIEPGDTLDVVGPSRRPQQGRDNYYRAHPASSLVISLDPSRNWPVVLSKWTEARVMEGASRMDVGLFMLVVAAFVGLVAFVIG